MKERQPTLDPALLVMTAEGRYCISAKENPASNLSNPKPVVEAATKPAGTQDSGAVVSSTAHNQTISRSSSNYFQEAHTTHFADVSNGSENDSVL